MGDRLAVAKLQVLWPLICAQLVYGLLKRRAEALELDFKEVQRWWGSYSRQGVAGCVTSGVQAQWKANLPRLESLLAAELAVWKEGNDTSFADAMAEMRASGSRGPLRRPDGAEKFPYAVMKATEEGAVRRMAGLSQEESEEKARTVARARMALIRPLLASAPTDEELENYAHSFGTSGASLRNWLERYWKTKSIESLMPQRVSAEQIRLAESVTAQLGPAMDDEEPVAPVGMPARGAHESIIARVPREKAKDALAQEIGRLRRVAVEQMYLRKGDAAGDHWFEEGGEKAMAWYVAMKTERPESLRMWCRAYEQAVRGELLKFTEAGSKEFAFALRALLDRNPVPLRDMGWSEQQIAETVRRGREAGARGIEPKKLTSSIVLEFNSHKGAMDGDGHERFMARTRRKIVFV